MLTYKIIEQPKPPYASLPQGKVEVYEGGSLVVTALMAELQQSPFFVRNYFGRSVLRRGGPDVIDALLVARDECIDRGIIAG